MVLVGDCGLLTSARIDVLRKRGGIDWLSALRAKEIQALAPLSVFDERDLAEIHAPAFPGERLVVCRNPLLAEERARHREALMAATEKMLERLSLRVRNGRLKRQEKIAEALVRIKNRFKVAKRFECVIGEGAFRYQHREERFANSDLWITMRAKALKPGACATLPANGDRRKAPAAFHRPQDDRRYLAILLDGKGFGDHLLVVREGINGQGEKHVLRIRDGGNKSEEVCAALSRT